MQLLQWLDMGTAGGDCMGHTPWARLNAFPERCCRLWGRKTSRPKWHNEVIKCCRGTRVLWVREGNWSYFLGTQPFGGAMEGPPGRQKGHLGLRGLMWVWSNDCPSAAGLWGVKWSGRLGKVVGSWIMEAPEGYAKELDFILRVMGILAPISVWRPVYFHGSSCCWLD